MTGRRQGLVTWASAKVNLFLHVGPRRSDGRHDLDSLVMFADAEAADRLVLAPARSDALTVEGPFADAAGSSADNLALKAVAALRAVSSEPLAAEIHLDKQLPVAAGLGGGSADAAAVLRALGPLAGLDEAGCLALAARLGGDVPAALLNRPCLMRGDGDRVAALTGLPALPAILVNPGAPCPTGQVFQAYDAAGGGAGFGERPLPAPGSLDALIDWLAAETTNDLEAPATGLVPAIAAVAAALNALSGVRLVRLSGSGATVFALFTTQGEAEAAAAELRAAHPDWWVRATVLGVGA